MKTTLFSREVPRVASGRFPRSLFGFSPRPVLAALEGLEADVRRVQADLAAERDRSAELGAEIERLRQERDLKAAALRVIESQQGAIARRLVAAELEAERIREQAVTDAEEMRAQWQVELDAAEAELVGVRRTIDGLRSEFVQLLSQTLELLSGSAAAAEPAGRQRSASGAAAEDRRPAGLP